MRIVVIDGQGGGLGRAIVEQLRIAMPEAEVTAVGANAMATLAMLKAGAAAGATGENAVRYNCARADAIIGALGIGFANAMHGEISPAMAQAVSESPAFKVLIPVTRCNVHIAGVADQSVSQYVADAVEALRAFFARKQAEV